MHARIRQLTAPREHPGVRCRPTSSHSIDHASFQRWRRRTSPTLLALFVLHTACTTPTTEVLVRLDTDAPPDRALTLRATAASVPSDAGASMPHVWVRGGPLSTITLPATFALTPASATARDGIVELTIDAELAPPAGGGLSLTFERRARFRFVPGTTGVLPIFLHVSCGDPAIGCHATDVPCTLSAYCEELGETCGDEGVCVSTDVTPTPITPGVDVLALDIVSDATAPTDAPAMDTPPIDSRTMDAPSRDTTSTDAPPTDGTVCPPGHADCDHDAENGCEADLTSPASCGACSVACVPGETCAARDGGYGCASGCPPGTVECAGSVCTDTATDPANCGGCARPCATDLHGSPTCTAGVCGITCASSYHDCTGACASNADPAHCGSTSCTPCVPPANASVTCDGTACGFHCILGWGDCDLVASNGCEATLSASPNCGTCGVACSGATPACVPAGGTYVCSATCTPGGPCSTGIECTTGTTTCMGTTAMCTTSSNVAAGTPCSLGVCDGHGACVSCTEGATCSTGNPCDHGTLHCATGAPVCSAASHVSAGTSCGTGQVCDGAGHCIACSAGSACSTGNPCVLGATACSTGAPVCMVQGPASIGTACSGGTCDGAGNCSTCSTGACATGDPCTTGSIECPAGDCVVSGSSPAGTPCGVDHVCNGGGTCVYCLDGAGCTSDPCTYYDYDCSSGAMVCTFYGYVAAGIPCGGGMTCDGTGGCD